MFRHYGEKVDKLPVMLLGLKRELRDKQEEYIDPHEVDAAHRVWRWPNADHMMIGTSYRSRDAL